MRLLFLYLILKNADPDRAMKGALMGLLITFAWLPLTIILAVFYWLGEVNHIDQLKSVNTPDVQLQRADYFFFNGGWLRLVNKQAADDKALESYEAIIDRFPRYENVDKAYLRAGDVYQNRRDYKTALARHTMGLQVTRRKDFIRTFLHEHKLLDECCLSRNCSDSRQYINCWNTVGEKTAKPIN